MKRYCEFRKSLASSVMEMYYFSVADKDKDGAKMRTIKGRTKGHGTLYKSRGRYYGRVTVNGRRITVSTNCTTREAADEFLERFTLPLRAGDRKSRLAHIEAEMRLIDGDVEEARRRANDLPVAEMVGRVLTIKTLQPGTERGYRSTFRRFVSYLAEKHPDVRRMSEITEEIATDYRDHLRPLMMPGTANIHLDKLRSAWASLSPSSPNPWRGIRLPGRSTPHKDLTEGEFDAVMAEARKVGGEIAYLFEVAAETAMRISDCALLRWETIDMERRVITFVPQKLRRYGRPIQLPMSRRLNEILSSRSVDGGRTGYVSPRLARTYQGGSVREALGRVFSAAGIPPNTGKSFHSLRVHAITKMLEAGIPLATVQAIAGHASPEMTQHYYRLDIDRAREAIDRLSASNGHKEVDTGKPPPVARVGGDIITLLGTLSPVQRAALKQLL